MSFLCSPLNQGMEDNIKLLHPYVKVKDFQVGIKSWKKLLI